MAGLRAWLRKVMGDREEPIPGTILVPMRGLNGSTVFVEGNNDFALGLYRLLRQSPGNLFFSPFSIRTALGMTLAGASGKTASQMGQALRIPAADEAVDAAFAEAIEQLNVTREGDYQIAVANSLWAQDGAPILPGFLDLIARHYGNGVSLVDFRRDAERARVSMNEWAEDKTGQRIRDLIPSGSLDADTRLVLLNAIYFKGIWEVPFERAATRDECFYSEDGGERRVPLMYRERDVRYFQGAGYQAVELVYRGGDHSLLVLLPDQRNGLGALENKLSERMIHDCTRKMAVRNVKLFLPRFKISWGATNLRNHLTTLGMSLAFTDSQADFSGINGRQPPHKDSLFLSAVLHKAFVEVREEGTEAAAATTVLMMEFSARLRIAPPPVPVFRADHPFLFAIRARKSGAILFLGSMLDPTLGG